MEVESCQNVSSSTSAHLPLQIDDFSSESSDSEDSLEEPLKKKTKLKVKIKPKVCKTGRKVKKKNKKKFTTFCKECNTNEESFIKLVKHVNTWHKVTSMKVSLIHNFLFGLVQNLCLMVHEETDQIRAGKRQVNNLKNHLIHVVA